MLVSFNAATKAELSWSAVVRRWGEAVVCGKKLDGMGKQNTISGPYIALGLTRIVYD
jgi:hypothetical protein